jgi:iron complex transport system ATP-binding protein
MSDCQTPRAAFAYQVGQLRFRYTHHQGHAGSGSQRWTLNGLTFEVARGESLGIIGPNGSGKTSLLKLLVKVLRPQEGTVHLFGAELGVMSQSAMARLVAYVPQDFQQIFPFTIAEMVLMGRFPHHQNAQILSGFRWESVDDIERARQAMDVMDVAHLANRFISDVSGGERQRAIIARALAQEPSVLLLDEPMAFLDLNHQLEICRTLRRLNEARGLTVIVVSHDLNLASQYCDRLMLMKEGQIALLGPPQDVIQPEVLEAVYGCKVLVDRHPDSGLPRVTLPGRTGIVSASEAAT